jgi:hypothetical protein
MLDAAVRKRLVWIGAPAGAGKTSVVTTYLEARGLPALWYNVDARDSDVANLFHYLSTAARLASKRSQSTLPVFSVENQAGVAAFARGFFEALGAERPLPSAIVIDDYQEARSELLDEVLREALSALPRGIVLFIISRTELPPVMARHLVTGDVASVGWADLRLTPTEIAGLIRLYRPDLRGSHLKAVLPQIIELANGWAAALTLLLQTRGLAASDAQGAEEFSERLFDYFATEIFNKMSSAQREFLLKTSVVPRFTPALAARLTGETDVDELVADFERRSYLIQRLGTSGVYRYHPLLRGFLLRRAEAAFGAPALRRLHREAAEALVAMDQIDEAMEQFETSQDVEAGVGLLLRVAPSYIAKGRGRTIETWIRRLPRERIEEDGWLLHWAAASCLAYLPSRSRELFERAFPLFEKNHDNAGLHGCCAGAIQAVTYEAMDYSRCDVWLERLATLQRKGAPCPVALLPMLATAMLMASIFRRPEAGDGRQCADRAMTLAATCEDVAHRVMTGGFLALRSVFHENIDRSGIFLETLRALAQGSEASGLSALTLLLSEITNAWARGDNAACIEIVREALALASRTGVFVWNDPMCATGLSAAFTSEDFDAAREFLALSRSRAEQGTAFAVGVYHFYASWDALLRGEETRALHLVELAQENADALNSPLAQSIVPFARAQISWQAGQKDEARAALARARQRAEQADYPFIRYGCDVVESDHEWDEDRERALARLRSGFKLAREGGYHNAFWLGKGFLTRAAVRALENDVEPEHVRATIAKHGLVPTSIPLSPDNWPFSYRIRALGIFELTRETRHLGARPLNRRETVGSSPLRGMPLRLLQTILAFGARRVRDVDLIDALWPDAEGDAGRRVLDTTLHRLRRQLGAEDVVRFAEGRVSLDERRCWVDVWALEHALAEAERQVNGCAPGLALSPIVPHLLALYRGPLLAEERGVWINGPRNRLAAKFRRIAERLVRALETNGRHDQASALHERASRGPRVPVE